MSIPLLIVCSVTNKVSTGILSIYIIHMTAAVDAGHVEHGKFTIVCNGGEYDVAFTAIIEKPYVMTSYGKIQSLDDFKKLSFRDAAEAVKLFRSRDFTKY